MKHFWLFIALGIISLISLIIIYICKKKYNNKHNIDLLFGMFKEKLNSVVSYTKHKSNFFGNYPVYYINLDRSPDRKTFMEEQFNLFNLNKLRRVNAVDGKTLTRKGGVINNNITFNNNYQEGTLSELGCLLSHIIAIKEAYYSGNDICVIFEDDMLITIPFLCKEISIDYIIDKAPDNWTMINLICYIECKKHYKNDNTFIPVKESEGCYCTGAYIINRKGMENILKGMDKYKIIIDTNNVENGPSIAADLFLYRRAIHSYVYGDKPLFIPNQYGKSTIQKEEHDFSQFYKYITDVYLYKNLDDQYSLINNYSTKPIPKILHQTWKTNDLPENFKKWSTECIKIHENWEYKMWTDEDNREFIKVEYPWFLNIYDTYDKNIKRVDAVRYFYLYHYGGVYIDMDFLCLKKLDPILEDGTAIFGYQLKNKNSKGAIANAFMIAPPKHPLFYILINNLQYTANKPVLEATGPSYLTSIINRYNGGNIKVYMMPIIYTHEWDDKNNKLKECENDINICRSHFPDSYTTTVWTNTWND